MAQTPSPSSGIGALAKWQQIALFLVIVLGGILVLNWVKDQTTDSPRAKALKQRIRPLAEQLEASSKVGYVLKRNELNDAITALTNEYATLSPQQRENFNSSPMKYCLIAVFNIADGIGEIDQSKHWASRSKYESAMDACK